MLFGSKLHLPIDQDMLHMSINVTCQPILHRIASGWPTIHGIKHRIAQHSKLLIWIVLWGSMAVTAVDIFYNLHRFAGISAVSCSWRSRGTHQTRGWEMPGTWSCQPRQPPVRIPWWWACYTIFAWMMSTRRRRFSRRSSTPTSGLLKGFHCKST